MSNFKPTEEQERVIKAFRTGGDMVIEAGAGTGKTSTLKLIAADAPKKTGIYIAYNKAIANDARDSFPASVTCATAHSFAFRAVGKNYKQKLDAPRMTTWQMAKQMGIRGSFEASNDMLLTPPKLARLVMNTVDRFCYSRDDLPGPQHVPYVPGLFGYQMDALRRLIAPLAVKAWEDIVSPKGRLKFAHDHYLKIWAMGNPYLPCDYLLLDEAQDANPVIAQVVEAQDHAQQILVGDRSQAIYGWRGAVDAMQTFEADHHLVLSQSFRFGEAVAEEANKWLAILDAPLRLRGFEKIDSRVSSVDNPAAILCRTNAEAISQALAAQEAGDDVALVGGTAEIKKFAEAALELQAGGGTWHPDLVIFQTWQQVQEYVNEGDGDGLKVMVNLIDTYGAQRVLDVADSTVNEENADVVISTAHKSKGREWRSVKIANDFREPDPNEEFDPESYRAEMMLAYVAVTRAKRVLDNEGLKWVDRLLDLTGNNACSTR